MDFSLSNEHSMMQKMVRDFAQISEYQLIQQKIAKIAQDYEIARLLGNLETVAGILSQPYIL